MADKYISVAGSTQIVADDGSGRFYPKVQQVIVNGDGSNTPLTATNGILNTNPRTMTPADQITNFAPGVLVYQMASTNYGTGTTYLANGGSAITTTTVAGITVAMLRELDIDFQLDTPTGSPSVVLYVDHVNWNGHIANLFTSGAITTFPAYKFYAIGPGTTTGSTALGFGDAFLLRWDVNNASTAINVSIRVIGK